ncbi:putative major capsid protein [Clarias magur]|uniref:Putative major capsid protein n=1 Tax=Clarias magur TaxID=1594786 RepID=A0A8J4TXT4_CLAMG|nr:putative major capsid protein [Clarias magur]
MTGCEARQSNKWVEVFQSSYKISPILGYSQDLLQQLYLTEYLRGLCLEMNSFAFTLIIFFSRWRM